MADGDHRIIEDRTGGRLGRHLWHDPRNRDYPARPLLAGPEQAHRRSWWRRGAYDQGHESSCTAQAAAGVLASSPIRQAHRGSLAHYDERGERYQLYREAQKVDPWPGENYEGSSTDAPFRVLRARGHIREWRWCFGIDDVIDALLRLGPVAVGTDWSERMAEPRGREATIEPGGALLGGHAYQLLGVNRETGWLTGINSWGITWGRNGRFRIRIQHLADLLEAGGEAATPIL